MRQEEPTMNPKLLGAVLLSFSAAAWGATFTVTTTADSGAGSLRQAILDANAAPGADTIVFAIPAIQCSSFDGTCVITPQSSLPGITEAVTIDGYTQAGSSPNTNPVGQGLNSDVTIALVGDGTHTSTGLLLDADDITVRGLMFFGGFRYGLEVTGHDGIKVVGNFLGPFVIGTAAIGNTDGLHAHLATHLVVGGTDPADRNLISGNSSHGALLDTCDGAVVQGNLIGTELDGLGPVPNGDFGLEVTSAADADTTIGGPGSGNLISGNLQVGLRVAVGAGSAVTIQGNVVGPDVTGNFLIGNGTYGAILASPLPFGGTAPGEGNNVAFSGFAGVSVPSGTAGVTIRGNRIRLNGIACGWNNLGIDLGDDHVPTPNDPGDSDGIQNFPAIASATPNAGTTEIVGVLHAKASTLYTLDFYSHAACLVFPRFWFEGGNYLGSGQVTTDGNGKGDFDVVVPVEITATQGVSAMATAPDGTTSEFSQRLPFSSSPPSGPTAGGTPITISGTDFEAGATLTIGGLPAGDVVVVDSHTITATTPAFAAGTANDLVVTNPDNTGGTLVKGWVADFLDVPPAQQFYSYVTRLVSNGLTAGIGGGLYGVNNNTLRQQMAVFLQKARHGLCQTPPPCQGIFADVPCPSPLADWIEWLFGEGTTGGCGGGNFCPGNPVRRDQMAPFLLKGKHGPAYSPPPCTGLFADVPCPSLFADWIEDLAAQGITGGCGGGNYCPQNITTRGQMAVFLVKTFCMQ
jgi:hypothetical protein